MSSVFCPSHFSPLSQLQTEKEKEPEVHQNCHFQIAWSINPHMKPGSSRLDLAISQHAFLKETLRDLGAEIIEVPFVCRAYDSVFAKDNAFLFEHQGRSYALMSQPSHPERKAEQKARARSLNERGFSILELGEDSRLEGGDLVVSTGIFMGCGFRTEKRTARALSNLTGIEVVALELVDPYLYHLDTALSILKDGTAVACREAFTPPAWRTLTQSPWINRIIEVTPAEARQFGCNLVQVGNEVIVGSFLPRLMRLLRRFGFKPRHVPLSEFQQAGGSAACLVAEVHDYERMSNNPTAAIRSMLEYA